MTALVADIDRLCRWVEELERRTVTKDHVSIVAARTTIAGVALLCAFGGLVIAGLQFT